MVERNEMTKELLTTFKGHTGGLDIVERGGEIGVIDPELTFFLETDTSDNLKQD